MVCRSVQAQDGLIQRMAVDASGGLLATSGTDRGVRVWDVEEGACTHAFPGLPSLVSSLAFHPDAHRLLVRPACTPTAHRRCTPSTLTCCTVRGCLIPFLLPPFARGAWA